MATHSFIGRLNDNGSITGVYCHFDGYPGGAGKLLSDHYRTEDLVARLLSMGSIRALNESIDKVSILDRDVSPTTYDSVADMQENVGEDFSVSYAYVWAGNTWSTYPV